MPSIDRIMSQQAGGGYEGDIASGYTKDQVTAESLNGYNIKNLQYPIDLGTNEEFGQQRVVFFINVQGGSKIATESPQLVSTAPKSRYVNNSGEKIKNQVDVGGTGDITKVLASKKRLKAAISLYIPEALTKSYNVSWADASSEEMIKGATIAQTILAATAKGPITDNISGVVDVAGNAGAAHLINKQKYLQKAIGVTPGNTKAEMLFNGVEFGKFSFDYRFAPRDKDEAANVLNIIRTFRYHMLPEFMNKEQFMYIYPSEFEVRYYNGDSENDFLERQITAVLVSMNINYNPNGQFTTFEDGMPTHINLSLSFAELALATKETSPADGPGA